MIVRSVLGVLAVGTLASKMDQRILKPETSSAGTIYNCNYKSTKDILASKLSFDKLWVINQPSVLSNNGGDTYLEHYIHEGLLQVADETGGDAGVLLAVMMEQCLQVTLVRRKSSDALQETRARGYTLRSYGSLERKSARPGPVE
ncbi:hypothetical protein NU219Hw_g4457t1 [Hortaea werneckii]